MLLSSHPPPSSLSNGYYNVASGGNSVDMGGSACTAGVPSFGGTNTGVGQQLGWDGLHLISYSLSNTRQCPPSGGQARLADTGSTGVAGTLVFSAVGDTWTVTSNGSGGWIIRNVRTSNILAVVTGNLVTSPTVQTAWTFVVAPTPTAVVNSPNPCNLTDGQGTSTPCSTAAVTMSNTSAFWGFCVSSNPGLFFVPVTAPSAGAGCPVTTARAVTIGDNGAGTTIQTCSGNVCVTSATLTMNVTAGGGISAMMVSVAQGDGTSPSFCSRYNRCPDATVSFGFCDAGGCPQLQIGNSTYQSFLKGFPMLFETRFTNTQTGGNQCPDPHVAATGGCNSLYQQSANDMAAYNSQPAQCNGHACIYAIRMNSEWPGNFSPWSPWNQFQPDQSGPPNISAADWVAGTCRYVNILRATPGLQNTKIEMDAPITAADQAYWPTPALCASLGVTGFTPIDLTGVDIYFGPNVGANSDAAWTYLSNPNPPAFNFSFVEAAAWGVSQGIPLVISEWCDQYRDKPAGSTNIARFIDWMAANNVVMHSYWDTNDGGVNGCYLVGNTNGEADYLAKLGGTHYTGTYFTQFPSIPASSIGY